MIVAFRCRRCCVKKQGKGGTEKEENEALLTSDFLLSDPLQNYIILSQLNGWFLFIH